MKIPEQPAKVYDLNILACLLGKIQIEELKASCISDIDILIDSLINELNRTDKPFVPHNDPFLLEEILKFINRILVINETPLTVSRITGQKRLVIKNVLENLKTECGKLKEVKYKKFISNKEIEIMFGLENMWKMAKVTVKSEAKRWNQKKHPNVPAALRFPVTLAETRRLILIFTNKVFKFQNKLKINSKLVNNSMDYHLYWNISGNGLDYVTPVAYGMDTQLSFDLPHNIAHLAHLSSLNNNSIKTYIDDMSSRAFFEAIAVFSEFEILNQLKNNPKIAELICQNFDVKRKIKADSLKKWMIKDREYEFRLRNARLYADLLATKSIPFLKIVDRVSKDLHLPYDATYTEILKYFPWTGLGATYTLGYRKLESDGIESTSEILNSNSPRNWKEYKAIFNT